MCFLYKRGLKYYGSPSCCIVSFYLPSKDKVTGSDSGLLCISLTRYNSLAACLLSYLLPRVARVKQKWFSRRGDCLTDSLPAAPINNCQNISMTRSLALVFSLIFLFKLVASGYVSEGFPGAREGFD